MTIRAHICAVNLNYILLCGWMFIFSQSCAGKKISVKNEKLDSELIMTSTDVSGNGKADTWRWTQRGQDGNETLLREEIDLNSDQKVDLRKFFENGVLSRITMDLDFDGKNDLTEFYENGALSRMEISHNFSGKIDTWRYYEKNELLRIERDTNDDGKPDQWIYFAQNRHERTGKDYNFDGIVDLWE